MDKISNNSIAIVTVCDNNYIMLLATLLKSIEINSLDEHIDFYIVEDKISKKNQEKFEKSFENPRIKIYWLKLDEVIPKDAKLPTDQSTYPLNIYVRLFIPYFISEELSRVIYLDVDMIVLKNIVELWNQDINGKTIAAVQEPSAIFAGGVKNFEALGIRRDSEYFNSGLLLIDNFQWRKNHITEKVLKCIDDNRGFTKYPDQYGLNVVFADNWFKLSSKWNTFSNVIDTDPYIIHFIGYKPIYDDYVGNDDYYRKFNYYMNQTLWRNYLPKSKYLRYLKKFKTKIKKQLHYSFKQRFNIG